MDYYRVRVYHPITDAFSLAPPSLILVAILVELVCLSLPLPAPILSAHSDLCSGHCAHIQGEIIARLAVHTTLRGESKIAAAAASLVA
jgi:hypothetical protein